MPEATHNRITLLGRLVRDPEIRDLDNSKMATFAVATTDTWRDRESQRQEKTQFHPVVIWNQALIEATLPHLKKGSRVLLEGSLEHRSYETDEGKRHVSEVVLRPYHGSIAMLDRAPRRPEEEPHAQNPAAGRRRRRAQPRPAS